MPQITVLTPFLLNLGGAIQKFETGIVEVTEEVASHWYAKLFSAPIAPPSAQEHVSDPGPADDQALANEEAQPDPDHVLEPAADEPLAPAEDDQPVDVDPPDEVNEKAALKAEAEALGIDVDGRWGVGRLKAEIEAKKNAA